MSGCRLIFGRKSGILIKRISYVRVLIYLQRYRSGHNGADSKSCDILPNHPNNFIWKRIEVVVTSRTRNHVSTLEVQTAEKPVTIRVCGQVQIVNWGLFYPVVLPNFHGLNFAGKWL